jgi:hypothetical protein
LCSERASRPSHEYGNCLRIKRCRYHSRSRPASILHYYHTRRHQPPDIVSSIAARQTIIVKIIIIGAPRAGSSHDHGSPKSIVAAVTVSTNVHDVVPDPRHNARLSRSISTARGLENRYSIQNMDFATTGSCVKCVQIIDDTAQRVPMARGAAAAMIFTPWPRPHGDDQELLAIAPPPTLDTRFVKISSAIAPCKLFLGWHEHGDYCIEAPINNSMSMILVYFAIFKGAPYYL